MQSPVGEPALTGGLDKVISRVPSNPSHLSELSEARSHAQIFCQEIPAWALLVTVGSVLPVFTGGSGSRCVTFWRTGSEGGLSALSLDHYIDFWGVRAKLILWGDLSCAHAGAEADGSAVPSCRQCSSWRLGSLDSAASPNQIRPQWMDS